MGGDSAEVSPTLTEMEDKADGPQIKTQGSFLEDTFSVVPLKDKLKMFTSSHFKEEDYEDLPPVDIDKRKCTNFLFLIFFILYWIGMFALAGVGFANGNPNLLVYGTDNEGNLCGEGVNSGKEYLAFPRLSIDVYESALQNPENPLESLSFFGVCLGACPNENDLICSRKAEQAVGNITSISPFPSRKDVIKDCIDNDLARLFIGLTDCKSTLIRDECFETDFNTTSYLFRCFPEYFYEVQVLEDESGCTKFKNITNAFGETETRCIKFKKVTKIIEEEPTDSDFLFDSFNSAARIVQGYAADVYKSYPVILTVGILVSTMIGFIYVSSLWCCVGLIVWASIILAVFILVVFTFYCYAKAGLIGAEVFDKVFDVYADTLSKTEGFFNEILNQAQDGDDINATTSNISSITAESGFVIPDFISESTDYAREYEVAAYCLSAITGIVIIMVLVLIPRIIKAIEIFNEASHAVRHNPALLLVPPVTMSLLIINLVFYLFATVYISSSGDIVIKELNLTVDTDSTIATSEFGSFDYTQAMNIYLLLGFFWTLNMVTGIATMTIAGVITAWYWAGSGKTGEYGYGIHALGTSFWVCCRFHLGSIAMGSFLIALIEVIRVIAAVISQRVAKVKQDSRLIKILLASINCFLKCVEKCIKFVSRNSFIMTAMYGPGFCRASSMAFFAIAHNLAQVATVTFLGDIIMRFGQLLISALCGLICWYVLDNDPKYQFGGEKELSAFWFPVLLCMILAFILARSVLAIYDVAVDTILLSYCQDRKRLDLRGKIPTEDELKSSQRFNTFIEKNKMTDEEFNNQQTAYSIH